MRKLLFSATDIAQLEHFANEVLQCSPTKLVVGGLNAVSAFVDQYVLEVCLLGLFSIVAFVFDICDCDEPFGDASISFIYFLNAWKWNFLSARSKPKGNRRPTIS